MTLSELRSHCAEAAVAVCELDEKGLTFRDAYGHGHLEGGTVRRTHRDHTTFVYTGWAYDLERLCAHRAERARAERTNDFQRTTESDLWAVDSVRRRTCEFSRGTVGSAGTRQPAAAARHSQARGRARPAHDRRRGGACTCGHASEGQKRMTGRLVGDSGAEIYSFTSAPQATEAL